MQGIDESFGISSDPPPPKGMEQHSSRKQSTWINENSQAVFTSSREDKAAWPVMIHLLGDFLLLRHGQSVPLRVGGKTALLLAYLALECGRPLSRTVLLNVLWPGAEPALASHSLRSLVLALHKMLAPALPPGPLVVHAGPSLLLNVDLGIGVDVRSFHDLAQTGDRHAESGDMPAAMRCYNGAVALYRGDLCIAVDGRTTMERERLRARCLTLLSLLADYQFQTGNPDTCLEYLWRLLAMDPCHEEAHGMVMRCYMRRGQRGAALRQYHLCVDLLRTRFGAMPERALVQLFEQIRAAPEVPAIDVTQT